MKQHGIATKICLQQTVVDHVHLNISNAVYESPQDGCQNNPRGAYRQVPPSTGRNALL